MLPPNELKNKEFTKAVRGYSPEEVDEHINFIIAHYTELYRENDELERKLKTTQAKLEAMKKDEESIRIALVNAQRAGSRIIDDANEQADVLIRAAKTNCSKVFSDFREQVREEYEKAAKLRAAVDLFRTQLFEAYDAHIEQLEKMEESMTALDGNVIEEELVRRAMDGMKRDAQLEAERIKESSSVPEETAEQTVSEITEAERIAAEKAEAERIAAEKAEAERIAAEKAEAERIAAEKAEAERIAAEKAEAERIAAEKAAAKAEAERIATEKAAAAAERAEQERIAAEKAAAEKSAAERSGILKIAEEAKKAEAEKLAAEKAEAERISAQKLAAEKAEAERIAAQKLAAEKAEAERIAAQKLAAEKAEAERIAAQKAAQAEALSKKNESVTSEAPSDGINDEVIAAAASKKPGAIPFRINPVSGSVIDEISHLNAAIITGRADSYQPPVRRAESEKAGIFSAAMSVPVIAEDNEPETAAPKAEQEAQEKPAVSLAEAIEAMDSDEGEEASDIPAVETPAPEEPAEPSAEESAAEPAVTLFPERLSEPEEENAKPEKKGLFGSKPQSSDKADKPEARAKGFGAIKNSFKRSPSLDDFDDEPESEVSEDEPHFESFSLDASDKKSDGDILDAFEKLDLNGAKDSDAVDIDDSRVIFSDSSEKKGVPDLEALFAAPDEASDAASNASSDDDRAVEGKKTHEEPEKLTLGIFDKKENKRPNLDEAASDDGEDEDYLDLIKSISSASGSRGSQDKKSDKPAKSADEFDFS